MPRDNGRCLIKYLAAAYGVIFIYLSGNCQDVVKADSLIDMLSSNETIDRETLPLLLEIAYYHPNTITSLRYANEALAWAEKFEEPLLQAKAYEEIGLSERLLGNQVKSVAASLNALKIARGIGASEVATSVLVQLGTNAVNDQDYDMAIDYLWQANQIYEKEKKPLFLGFTMVNLGEVYRLNQQWDSAVYCFEVGLRIGDSLNRNDIRSYALGNLGMVFRAQGRRVEARSLLSRSLSLVEELGDPYTHSVYLAEMALIDQEESHTYLAESKFIEALALAQKYQLKEQVRDISKMLVVFYKQQQAYDKALSYQERYQIYQDSLVDGANIRKVEQLKANYEIEQKELEINHLSERHAQEKRKKLSILIVLVVFIGLSVLLFRSNRQKNQVNVALNHQKQELAMREEDKALLLKELNHRVKNNLQMISSLLHLQGHELQGHPAGEAIMEGRYRVDALALIHQKLYREAAYTKIPLKDYVEELVLSLVYSFGDQVMTKLEVEDVDMGVDQVIPLALILNELVTNALKYAFESIQEPVLTVFLYVEAEQVVLVVQDNGVGFKVDDNGSSFGIKLVYSLSEQLKASIINTMKEGTRWIIRLPRFPVALVT